MLAGLDPGLEDHLRTCCHLLAQGRRIKPINRRGTYGVPRHLVWQTPARDQASSDALCDNDSVGVLGWAGTRHRPPALAKNSGPHRGLERIPVVSLTSGARASKNIRGGARKPSRAGSTLVKLAVRPADRRLSDAAVMNRT